MKLSILARFLFSYPLLKLGIISNRIRRYSKNSFLILMYHRILTTEDINCTIQPGMYVLNTTFKMHLEFIGRHFSVVSIDKLIEGKLNDTKGKPLCAITFDDGWLDFYRHAYPSLTSLDIPATVFLPTDFISSNKLFWTDILAKVLRKGIKLRTVKPGYDYRVEAAISEINDLQGPFEERLEKAIDIFKQFPQEAIEQVLSESMSDDHNSSLGGSFLNWDQVREMKGSGLISFGSHTCSHRILTTLKDDEIYDELKKSRQRLLEESACDEGFAPFCYPNGNYNERIVALVKEAGYNLAVTTRNGLNQKGCDRFALKRIGIHNDMTFVESLFGYRIANFSW